MMDLNEKDAVEKSNNSGFTKDQLLRSTKYTPQQRDILRAVLIDGKAYTHDQAKAAMNQFLKKEAR